jgi:hypothetical protein
MEKENLKDKGKRYLVDLTKKEIRVSVSLFTVWGFIKKKILRRK